MRSLVVKRSFSVRGHKTSVTLEEPFWKGLHDIAWARRMTLSALVDEIDARRDRESSNLSSHIRLFVFEYFCARPGRTEPLRC